jgi:hypothetical protein
MMRMIWSEIRKNTAAIADMMNTIAVVTAVSRRVGRPGDLLAFRTHFLQELEW